MIRKVHQFQKKPSQKKKLVFLGVIFLFFLGASILSLDIFYNGKQNKVAVVSSELNIAEVSPRGESSGLVVPASCGTIYAGAPGHPDPTAPCNPCNICGSCNTGTSLCGACDVSAPPIPYNTASCTSIGYDVITNVCTGSCACNSGRSYFSNVVGNNSSCCENRYRTTCTSNSPSNVCSDYYADSRGTYACDGSCPATGLSAPPVPYTTLSCTSRGYDTLINACNGECGCNPGRAYDISINQCVNPPVINFFRLEETNNYPTQYISYDNSTSADFTWDTTTYGATFCRLSGSGITNSYPNFAFEAFPPGFNAIQTNAPIPGVSFTKGVNTTLVQVKSSEPDLPLSGNGVAPSGSQTIAARTGVYTLTCQNVAGPVSKDINVNVVCPPLTYNDWSACSASCGGGTRTRQDTNCFGSTYTETCNTQACTKTSWKEVLSSGTTSSSSGASSGGGSDSGGGSSGSGDSQGGGGGI